MHKLYPRSKKSIPSTSNCLHYFRYYFPLLNVIVTLYNDKLDDLSLCASFCIKTQLKIFYHIQDNLKVLQRITLSHCPILPHTFPISI